MTLTLGDVQHANPVMMFEDKVVWITGASSGIGRELARMFAREGAHVAVSARREERLHSLAAEIEKLGRRGLAVPCDVSDEAQISAAVQRVVDHFGRLDVAVANAGFGVYGKIERLTAAEWRRQFDVNVVGLALTARFALPHLRQTRGRVVLVGSVAGMLPVPRTGAYGASKAAVLSIGRTLAAELHGSGVTCTTIHPGFVESEITSVDNEGIFREGVPDPRPKALMWPAERAARVMVRAIYKRKREFVFTGHGRIGGFAGRHWPALMHFVMSRRGR